MFFIVEDQPNSEAETTRILSVSQTDFELSAEADSDANKSDKPRKRRLAFDKDYQDKDTLHPGKVFIVFKSNVLRNSTFTFVQACS